MVNYCTMAMDSGHEDALVAVALVLNEKEQQISELENKLYSLASELPTSGEEDTSNEIILARNYKKRDTARTLPPTAQAKPRRKEKP